MQNKLAVLVKEPGKEVEVAYTTEKDFLKFAQEKVGGYIEMVPTHIKGLQFIVNEEGKLLDLDPNFYSGMLADIVFGTALIVRVEGPDVVGLTLEDAVAMTKAFQEVQPVSMTTPEDVVARVFFEALKDAMDEDTDKSKN